jgi:hypothetical protein
MKVERVKGIQPRAQPYAAERQQRFEGSMIWGVERVKGIEPSS